MGHSGGPELPSTHEKTRETKRERDERFVERAMAELARLEEEKGGAGGEEAGALRGLWAMGRGGGAQRAEDDEYRYQKTFDRT